MIKNLSIWFLMFLGVYSYGQKAYFEYDSICFDIYETIIDLKLDIAQEKLETAQAQNPENLAFLHLENYVDFFRIFINEDEQEFKKLEKNKKRRIRAIKERLDKNSPYYNFVLAELNLQWAVARAKFNQLFRSGREILNAYSYLKTNSREHPDFIYNLKSLSIIHSLIETITIPGFIKGFLGIKGSVDLGLEEIKTVLNYSENNSFIFLPESEAIYTFILFYQANDPEGAWAFINRSHLNPESSSLACFLYAKIAQRSGRNAEALEILDRHVPGEDYSSFLYLELLKGISKLRELNPESIEHITLFIKNFKGRHYIKEAYQKLAWAALVFHEDIAKYKYYMGELENNGYSLLDDDKQAQKEADSGIIPDPDLLRARLLCDGGYYERAYNLLARKEHKYYNDPKFQMEYYYRTGRIAQALKNYPEALQHFGRTINYGKKGKIYFACNSALQMGLIYEQQKDWGSAEKYYRLCLAMSPEDYKNSLHQKAKTGLNRLKKE